MTLALAVLALALAAGALWFAFLLLEQNGRVLARLEALEAAASARHADSAGSLAKSRIKRDGLAAGDVAPDFTLPRVGGGELSLSEFKGRQLLLVFSDPQCGPCDVLAPQLERRSRAEDIQVVMVSRGDPAANEMKQREHRLSFPIALQHQWEVSKLYAMFATPIAYLIDEDGVIAAPVAKGRDAILGLFSHAASMRALV